MRRAAIRPPLVRLGVATLLLVVNPTTALGGGAMHCDTVHNPDDLDTAALERTFQAWSEAVAASDSEAVGELVAGDATFWSHGQPSLVGRAATVSAFRDVFETYRMRQDFECTELILSGRWAFVRGVEHNELTPRGGGESVEVRQRAFSVLHRGDDGEWRFARGMTNQEAPGG